MSTPYPIRIRAEALVGSAMLMPHQKPKMPQVNPTRRPLSKCQSNPNLLGGDSKRKSCLLEVTSQHAGDLALQPCEGTDDTEDDFSTSEETASSSDRSSQSDASKQLEILDNIMPTYAEALWDHVTLDPEELAFRVGEMIRVVDMNQKDWWFGLVDDRQGWFPATFVRLRANPHDPSDDIIMSTVLDPEGNYDDRRCSCVFANHDQARTNVVLEILGAEKDYVKHLRDVVEGYLEKTRKRPEMFPESRIATIFSNIEEIYRFSRNFLTDLERHINEPNPSESELGKCFLKHKWGFEIYSEYCNNHPFAFEELRQIQKDKKFLHFFEACRLLQDMIEIPLEGFLLTPVQKICKYPLQLKELLKYTGPGHPEHRMLQEALESMRHIALLINERKRKLESIEKIAQWQSLVQDWEGSDIYEHSSELIYSGEMTKVNSSGWHQERVFFLFDHQLIYCKKDLLWRDLLIYKGRFFLENCDVHSIQDGRDPVFNVTIRHGLKICDRIKSKWYLLYCKTSDEKTSWLKAFDSERHRVLQDRALGFNLDEHRKKHLLNRQLSRKDKKKKRYGSKDCDLGPQVTPKLTTKDVLKYAHTQSKSSGLLQFIKRKSTKK